MIAALRLSFGLFTVLPVAARSGPPPTPRQIRAAVLLAPLVGLLLGLVAATALWGARALLLGPDDWGDSQIGNLLTAAVALAALQAMVGAMHLDGLADTVDGIAADADRDRTLAIMRRSDIGPMAVVAVGFTLLLQTAALALAELRGHGTIALVTAVVTGRLAAVWACRRQAARPDGLGAWVAGSVSPPGALLATGAVMGVPALLVARDDDPAFPVLPVAVAAVAVGILVAEVLQRRWQRRLGGITGDSIGAVIEVATTVALLVVAAAR
jgi:adenosylcobinamide-GDP ribazoletransferase